MIDRRVQQARGQRVRGCLLGGALGDALGAPVKHLRLTEIPRRFGPDGLQEFAPAFGRLGAITDDTQMTLFTAEGVIRAHMRACDRGICFPPAVVAHAYQRSLLTEGEPPMLSDMTPDGWLWQQRGLHQRRGPAGTCIAGLKRSDLFDSERPARNRSKRAGAIMRTAPVALATDRDDDDGAASVFELAIEIARLTHGHRTAWCATGAYTVILHALLWEQPLSTGLRRARQLIQERPGHEETVTTLDRVEDLVARDALPDQAFSVLGRGRMSHEALGIAIYCASTADSFEAGVRRAVNHDGDSDTTGALAGQLLGAMMGEAALPARWLADLELREVVEQVADDLFTFLSWEVGEYVPATPLSRELYRRYPPN